MRGVRAAVAAGLVLAGLSFGWTLLGVLLAGVGIGLALHTLEG